MFPVTHSYLPVHTTDLPNLNRDVRAWTEEDEAAIDAAARQRQNQPATLTPRERILRQQLTQATVNVLNVGLTWVALALIEKFFPPADANALNFVPILKRLCLLALVPLGAQALFQCRQEYMARRCAATTSYVGNLVANARARAHLENNERHGSVEPIADEAMPLALTQV